MTTLRRGTPEIYKTQKQIKAGAKVNVLIKYDRIKYLLCTKIPKQG
jgi:hypothetical protein